MGVLSCGECGIPRLISLMHRWRDDGILVSRMGAVRGIFIERGAFAGSLDSIEEALGAPIDHIIIEAKRRDAKLYVDDILAGPLGAAVRLRPLRRLSYLVIIRQGATIGLAKSELLAYKPGERLIGRANPVYHPVLFTADVCGAFESIEGRRARAEYGRVGESWYAEMRTDENLPRDERLGLERTAEVPAQADHERCGACGVPRQIMGFRWETKEGKIIDTATGEWVIYINVAGLNAILRELEGELGETIPSLVCEHSFRYYRGLVERSSTGEFSDLAFMTARGWGVPEATNPTPQQLADGIKIRNAFNGPLIAGAVAAICGGGKAEYSWRDVEPGIVEVKAG